MAARSKAMGVSKLEAVRMALKEIGSDAKPVKIQEFVKAKFGLDMTTAHVSNYKTLIGRESKKQPAGVTVAGVAPVATVAAKSSPTKSVSGIAVSLEDIGTVKELVGRVGEKSLTELIGILQG